jgi:HIRAN domain-containing protein
VTGIALVAAIVLLILTIYFALRTKTPAFEELKNHPREDVAETVVSQHPDDDAFEAAFKKHIAPHTNKYFNARIAGASSPNADDISRRSIIEKCEPMEVLRLELEPNNPADPQAIAVKRVDGTQLGYLERGVASDLHRDAGKPVSWSAIFKYANRHPSTDEVVGAVVVLTRSNIEPGDQDR